MAKQYQGSSEITSQVIIPFRVSLAKHHSVFCSPAYYLLTMSDGKLSYYESKCAHLQLFPLAFKFNLKQPKK